MDLFHPSKCLFGMLSVPDYGLCFVPWSTVRFDPSPSSLFFFLTQTSSWTKLNISGPKQLCQHSHNQMDFFFTGFEKTMAGITSHNSLQVALTSFSTSFTLAVLRCLDTFFFFRTIPRIFKTFMASNYDFKTLFDIIWSNFIKTV